MTADPQRERTEPTADTARSAGVAGPGPAGAGPMAHDGGPVSILTCTTCGKKNRIRPSERGAPHCGSCGAVLPWLVAATDETFDIESRAGMSVLVDLWAPWCGPCRYVGPIVEDISREYAGRIKVVKVNVDESPMVAARFDARSIPTLVVLRNGRVVDRVVGALPKSQLVAQLMPHLLRR
jgi:thioredoxin 2